MTKIRSLLVKAHSPAVLVCVILFSSLLLAEDEVTIYDRDWRVKERIQDGTIYDRDWNVKGHIRDGKVYDRNWNVKGHIKRGK